METVISATILVRQLGDVLGRLRYRGESFVIERNGVPVARLVPVTRRRRASIAAALRRWQEAAAPEPAFADALEQVGADDQPPDNPWAS